MVGYRGERKRSRLAEQPGAPRLGEQPARALDDAHTVLEQRRQLLNLGPLRRHVVGQGDVVGAQPGQLALEACGLAC